jgi:hypothetical protein
MEDFPKLVWGIPLSQKGFGGFDTSDQRGKLMDDMLAVLSR